MSGNDIDFQIFLEVGHVLPNVQQLRFTGETPTPSTTVDGAQHDVIARIEPRANDDSFQFGSIDDERLAVQTEAARLVEKD